jgi:hypothetical protein
MPSGVLPFRFLLHMPDLPYGTMRGRVRYDASDEI